MKPILFLLLAVVSSVTSNEKYSLYRIQPNDHLSIQLLNQLQANDFKYGLDFWKEPAHVGDSGDVMVKAGRDAVRFETIMSRANITYDISVPDVGRLIKRNEGSKGKFWQHDDPILDSEPDRDQSKVGKLKKAKYPFGDYASYTDMVKYMRTIEFYYPSIAKIVRIGSTHENKPIEGLKIGSTSKDGSIKKAVWVDGNIHAREWASSHTALYFINQLISGYEKDPTITHYIDTLDFYIVPCLNPDGYEYTRSSPIPSVRLWRKNRSPEVCKESIWGGEKCCQGVDLNRNFHFHWAERGSSTEPCSNIYHGEEVFSEPETSSVRDFLTSADLKDRVEAFFTLHSYAQLWIYPYSHEENSYPEDIAELRRTARRAINRLTKVYGTMYRMGTGADTLSPASGGSDDWAKAALDVRYVYLIELRPQMELSNGFILHKKELIPTAVETFEGFREVVDAVLEKNGIQMSPLKKISASQKKKQLYRLRLLQSEATSTTDAPMSSDRFARLSQRIVHRQTPPKTPPTVAPSTTEVVEEKETRTETTTLATTSTTRWLPRLSDLTTTASPDAKRSTFGFYTQTQPATFADPTCRDMRYSCGFWLRHNPEVCQAQETFMKAQCAYTCKFCTSFLKRQ